MLDIRLAKSMLENEEGMNHLEIQISPTSSYLLKDARLFIHLPVGVYRLENLNTFYEDSNGVIVLDNVSCKQNIIVELYTQELIECEETKISVDLSYKDHKNNVISISESIPLYIVNEEEMEEVTLNEEVIDNIKNLLKEDTEQEFVLIPPKIQTTNNQISNLERKYRIDFYY